MRKQKHTEVIYNYLKNLDINGNVSVTESEQMIDAYIHYLFELKNIDINSIQYVVHKSDIDEEDDFVASMNKEGERLFNIYLPKDYFRIYTISQVSKALEIFRDVGHETHHIFQYLKAPKLMKKYDDFRNAIYDDIDILKTTKYNARNKLPLIRRLIRLKDINNDISRIENNAEFRTCQYLDALFQDLKSLDVDNSLNSMLNCFEELLEDLRRNRFILIKDTTKDAEKTIALLREKHNFSKDYAKIF